jgi:hypothetical protein
VAADRVTDSRINRLKQWRGIATGSTNGPSTTVPVVIVSLLLWLA